MKETLTRTLTGIVFVALVILSLIIHPAAYLVLFSIFCFVAWIELAGLMPESIPGALKIPGAVLIAGCFALVYCIAAGHLAHLWLAIPPGAMLLLILIAPGAGRHAALKRPFKIFLSWISLLAFFSVMHMLGFKAGSQGEFTPRWILFTLYLIWMFDTMAYVSGRLAGKHPIWPSVSPAKTWEGSIGGSVCTVGLAVVLSRYFTEISTGEWVVLAGIIIIFGSLGDFFESWLKRRAGVKDSGSLLPGHGGILDRFDSFLFALPPVTLYLTFLT
jgi:phosphatidate cytidylyltransferase